jgi:hypothetical protein
VESVRDNKGQFRKGRRASVATEFKPGQHWRPHQAFREKDILIDLYINKKMSTGDIATQFNVTDGAIQFWLRKLGIPRRTTSEARAVKHWVVSGAKNGMTGRCGDKAPNWIDGSSRDHLRVMNQSFWRTLMVFVFERDGYKCKRCGEVHCRSNRLHSHHVKPWAGHEDTRFDLNNIITVCQKCHNWIHSRENVNREYLAS